MLRQSFICTLMACGLAACDSSDRNTAPGPPLGATPTPPSTVESSMDVLPDAEPLTPSHRDERTNTAVDSMMADELNDRRDDEATEENQTISPPEQLAEQEPSPANLYRLTRQQYLNSVRDLFGPNLSLTTALEPDTPLHGFASVGAGEITISPLAVEKFEAAAFEITQQVFGDRTRGAQWLECDDVSPDSSCLREAIAHAGRRIWRRPLTDDELAAWMDVYAEVNRLLRDPWVAVAHVISGLLQSPDFLFRVEIGEPHPNDSAVRRYTQYEMASRLSYFLWDSTPDLELLDAAEAGALTAAGELHSQVTRLLDDPRSETALRSFFAEYLHLDRLDSLQKDRALFPLMDDTLGSAMRFEIESVIARLIFEEDADIRTLLTTRDTVVNDQLAGLYQLAPVEGWADHRYPERSPRGGFFTMAGFLALNAHNTVTSPTYRGKYIQNKFFCFDIPPPPPGVAGELLEDSDGSPMTTRQKLARHRADPSCNACHQFMDPLGLALENFDALGMWRTTENGLPIDASGEFDGITFYGGKRLGELVSQTTDFGDCLTTQIYRRGMAHLEGEHEADIIESLQSQFEADGYRVRSLLETLVLSQAFRHMEGRAP